LGKQRKVTRALDARGKAKGCGNKKIKSQYKKGWIPAFAGMTSGSKSAGLHAAVLQRALRAIRCASVRFGILPSQSGNPCRNDKQKTKQELDSGLRRNDERRAGSVR
jgi:hypothetical protein